MTLIPIEQETFNTRSRGRAPENGCAKAGQKCCWPNRGMNRWLRSQPHGIRRTTRGPSAVASGSGRRRQRRGPHANAGSSGEGVATVSRPR